MVRRDQKDPPKWRVPASLTMHGGSEGLGEARSTGPAGQMGRQAHQKQKDDGDTNFLLHDNSSLFYT